MKIDVSRPLRKDRGCGWSRDYTKQILPSRRSVCYFVRKQEKCERFGAVSCGSAKNVYEIEGSEFLTVKGAEVDNSTT